MNQWLDDKLGTYLEFRNGRTSPPRLDQGRFPVYGSNGKIGFSGEENTEAGSIVIGRVGTYCGSLHYSSSKAWVTDNAIICTAPNLEGRFWFYALSCLDLNNYRAGSGQPLLNQAILKQIRFVTPTRGERLAIGSILGALDDKIELNRQMNETLEAMARAIFKDWFVDFGPTRTKMAMRGEDPQTETVARAPYLAPEIWSLFPDRLDDQGKPEGWIQTKLGELCSRIAIGPFGSDITTDNFVASGVPVIRGGNLKAGFIDAGFVFLTEEKATSLKNAVAYPGDIIITHRGTLGQVGIIPEAPRFSRYVISQSQMLLSADLKIASPRYLFEFLRSEDGINQLLSYTSQTGVPAIARPTTSLKSIDALKPPHQLLRTFDEILAPLVQRESANLLEIETLSATRDLLLPKLMSGTIRVKDAEALVGEVA